MRLLSKFMILLILFSHVAFGFRQIEENLCNMPCAKNGSTKIENTACKCVRTPECLLAEMSYEEVLEFRRRVLDKINEVRDSIASGNGGPTKRNSIPTSANMELINYDLALEYNAACRSLNCVSKMATGCECTRSFPIGVCQTQWAPWTPGFKLYDFLIKYEEHVNEMFEAEMPFITNSIIATFKPDPKYPNIPIIMWSSVNRVGCALSVAPNQRNATATRLVCNYGSRFPYCNTANAPIYESGVPCKKCRELRRCNNTQFTHLCGSIQPVPTDALNILLSEQKVKMLVSDLKGESVKSIGLPAALPIIIVLFQSLLTYLC